MTKRKVAMATVRLLLDVEHEDEASDLLSVLLTENGTHKEGSGIIDWSHLKGLDDKFDYPEMVDYDDSEYENGKLWEREHANSPTLLGRVIRARRALAKARKAVGEIDAMHAPELDKVLGQHGTILLATQAGQAVVVQSVLDILDAVLRGMEGASDPKALANKMRNPNFGAADKEERV